MVNAVTQRDLEVFALGLLQAETAGKRFLYRTAASFIPIRAGMAPPTLLTAQSLQLPTGSGGLIIVGSYVPKTTRQLEQLLAETAVYPVQVQVEALLDNVAQPAEIARVVTEVDAQLAANQERGCLYQPHAHQTAQRPYRISHWSTNLRQSGANCAKFSRPTPLFGRQGWHYL